LADYVKFRRGLFMHTPQLPPTRFDFLGRLFYFFGEYPVSER